MTASLSDLLPPRRPTHKVENAWRRKFEDLAIFFNYRRRGMPGRQRGGVACGSYAEPATRPQPSTSPLPRCIFGSHIHMLLLSLMGHHANLGRYVRDTCRPCYTVRKGRQMGPAETLCRVRQEVSSTSYLDLPPCSYRDVSTTNTKAHHGAYFAMQSPEVPETVE